MVNSALLLASEGFWIGCRTSIVRLCWLSMAATRSSSTQWFMCSPPPSPGYLYLSLFYIVVKNHNSLQRIGLIVGCAGLCILFAGAVDDLIVKPTVARWRPTHDPVIGTLVDIVEGYRGGKYGFFSAHACNTFSIAVFFCWLVRSWALSFTLVIWSLTNCWTRLYLGVHFPGDILVGLTWGFIVGTSVYFLYRRITRNWRAEGRRYITTEYTAGGFERPSCEIPVAVFYFTVIFALLIATYQ